MWFQRHKIESRGETDSKAALVDAVENLHRTQGMTIEVREVATALRDMREKNHFAERLSDLMKGTPHAH